MTPGSALHDPWTATEAVVVHPDVVSVAVSDRDRDDAARFAWDLAAWLYGAEADSMGVLGRVVVTVLGRDLTLTRQVCERRAPHSVEAAARTTAALWPLLRALGDPEEPEASPDPEEAGDEPSDGQGEGGGGGGIGGGGDDDGDADAEPDPQAEGDDGGPSSGEGGDGDGDSVLDQLARILDAREQAGADAAGARREEVFEAGWRAAQEADAVVGSLQRLIPGAGWAVAPGHLDDAVMADLGRLSALLERLPELEALADLLGRAEAEATRQGPSLGGGEEVVGVRVGGDVAWALPSELALLADESTEDLFYQRFAEHRLVSLALAGAGMDGSARADKRGPIIACIDTSGSMAGPPEVVAKALVLAVCRTALPQRRPVHLLQFGGTDELAEVRLRPGPGGLDAFVAFLSRGFRGGTDFDTPLVRALDLLEEQELAKADILVITDGLAMAAPSIVARVHAVRASLGVRVWTALVGGIATHAVEAFSDEVWRLEPDGAASVRLATVVRRLRDEGQHRWR